MQINDKVNYSVHIKGRVQGVGFRYSAVNIARKLGIFGFVKNVPDGSVLMEIEGGRLATEQMIEWSKHGPSGSRVDDIYISETEPKGYKTFEVRY